MESNGRTRGKRRFESKRGQGRSWRWCCPPLLRRTNTWVGPPRSCSEGSRFDWALLSLTLESKRSSDGCLVEGVTRACPRSPIGLESEGRDEVVHGQSSRNGSSVPA
eukprot:scaffold1501_cov352-Pavlova_lutheri.AAC.30